MRGRSGWMASAIVCGMLVTAGAAEAKTFEVTRTNDPNPGKCKPRDCSLREAILAANERVGRDVIVLPARRYKLTRANPGGVPEDVGVTGDLDVNNDPLSIRHSGKGRARIDGNELDRVLQIQLGAPTALKKLAVANGSVDGDGGGILSEAPLVLQRSTVADNTATDDGGGLDLDENGSLRMTRSAVLDNETTDFADSDGAGINLSGDGTVARLVRSSVSGNSGAGNSGGIEVPGGDLTLSKSTVAGNRAAGSGGGLGSDSVVEIRIKSSTISGNRTGLDGGGLKIAFGSVSATNSTFAGNRADNNGGGINSTDGASVELNAVTVARNLAGADDPGPPPVTGGGIYQIDSAFEVRNTLIGLNEIGQGGLVANDCEGETFTSLGNNLLSTKLEGDGFTQPTDLERANPKIGTLKNNGGPTKTVELKRGSAAIGKAHKPSAPNRDQRGRKRDNQPDIGAFERGA
jgi:fibronectin-binding autotransporter adhesin